MLAFKYIYFFISVVPCNELLTEKIKDGEPDIYIYIYNYIFITQNYNEYKQETSALPDGSVCVVGVQVPLVFTPLPTTFTAFTVIRYTVWFDPLKGTHIVVEI